MKIWMLFFAFALIAKISLLSAQEDFKTLSLEELIKHVSSTDNDEILDALTEIEARGKSASSVAPQLIILLNHEDEWVRLAAADTLVKLGSDVLELFPTLFQTKSAQKKILACRIIGELGENPEKVFPLLKQGLQDSSEKVQIATIHAIGQFQKRAEELLPLMLPFLQSSSREIQKEAIGCVGEINPNGLDVLKGLVECASLEDEEVHLILGEALSKISKEAQPHLGLLLKALAGCENKYLKSKFLEAIGNIADIQALEDVLTHLEEENYLIRYQTLKAIQKIHALNPEQFKKLVPLFQDPYELIRLLLPEVMAELQIQESVPYLVTLLNDINIRVRMSVVRALGRIKPASSLQIRGLLKALQDVQMNIVQEAVISFGELGPEALPASDTLMRFASVAKGEMLISLLKSLARIKPAPEKWGPVLEKILGSAKTLHRIWGYYALYETCLDKQNEATSILIQYLESEQGDLRHQTLEAITQLNPPNAAMIEAMLRQYPSLQPHEQEIIVQCFFALKIDSRLEPYRREDSSEKK
ncbi:MAG: HEAT repeat domain-containing protein [Planctomycetota bacterium]